MAVLGGRILALQALHILSNHVLYLVASQCEGCSILAGYPLAIGVPLRTTDKFAYGFSHCMVLVAATFSVSLEGGLKEQ